MAQLDWELNGFSDLYHRNTDGTDTDTDGTDGGGPMVVRTIGRPRLRWPYPSSNIFTTEFEHVTAQWKIRLEPTRVALNFEFWNFHLDLLNTGPRLDHSHELEPTASKKQRGISFEITVDCCITFLTTSGQETGYSNYVRNTTFGPKCDSVQLCWPRSIQDRECNEVGLEGHGCNETKNIIGNLHKWMGYMEDILRVRVIITCVKIKPSLPDPAGLTLKLSSDLSHILETGEFSDVVVTCTNSITTDAVKTFQAHKLILSLRSPVFKTMFSSNMSEATSGNVEVKDVQPAVMKLLLEYIYTGKVELGMQEQETIVQLSGVADKYDVSDLKEFCFEHLLTMLSHDTCGDLAVGAYLHNAAPSQKDWIFEYVAKNWGALAERPEFINMVKNYPLAFVKHNVPKPPSPVHESESNDETDQ